METPKFEGEKFNWAMEVEGLDLGAVDAGELVDFLKSLGLLQNLSLKAALRKAKEIMSKGLDEVDENTNEVIANMSSELEDFIINYEAEATV